MRRLSGAQLAEVLGVSRQAVSNYEAGTQTPSPDVLRRMADVLRFPMQRFTMPQPQLIETATFWRSLLSATKAERVRSKHRVREVAALVSIIEQHVELPRVNFPDLGLPDDPERITDDMIDEAADATRRHWGLGTGPISNIAWLLENHGAIVVRQFLDAQKLDAFSRWIGVTNASRPIVVLGTDHASAVRSRFDAAHELGHLILHRHLQREEPSGARYDRLEGQAHAFARAFLLPEQSFVVECRVASLEAFRSLKIRWQASIQVMIERLYRLGIITDEARTTLWRNLTRRGWRKVEPLDDMLKPEEPRLLGRALDMLLSQGIQSPQSLELLTGLHPWEIADVAGLPERFFSRDDTPLRLIPQDQQVDEAWLKRGSDSISIRRDQMG